MKCAMCQKPPEEKNLIVMFWFAPRGHNPFQNGYTDINLHVPCAGVFLVVNHEAVLRTAPR